MAKDIYHRLAQHLDELPGGFPSTESGVELRILQRLFTPQDAELALHLTLIPEGARVVAHRAKRPLDEIATRLAGMEKKGLIYALHSEGKPPQYQASQFVVGIWEYQVNKLDPELIQLVEEYMPHVADTAWHVPQLRTVPVRESISAQMEILPYERVDDLVRAQKTLAVAPCICRQERKMVGEGCDKPEESCLVFGTAADYWVRNGMGRYIDQSEALAILSRAEEAGLVLQPANAKDAVNICTCCGCCCGVLRTVKLQPKPADVLASPFVAMLDVGKCQGCGVCLERCQMEALSLDGDRAVLDLDRCIGCGLCVTTCPEGALSLARKPESEQAPVPQNLVSTYLKLGRSRGKLKARYLAKTLVRSGVDRLLARG
jgi:ferredoxin